MVELSHLCQVHHQVIEGDAVPELTIHPVVAQPTGSSHDLERSPSISPTDTIVPSRRPEAPENPEDYDEDDYEMDEQEGPISREEVEALALAAIKKKK